MSIADTNLVLDIDEIEEETTAITRTYSIDFANGKLGGYIDGIDAVRQAITKIMLTERFKNLIYSDEYASEHKALMMSGGNTDSLLEAEIPALIKEALLVDDRILDVDNFTLELNYGSKDAAKISFNVSTIYGEFSHEEVI